MAIAHVATEYVFSDFLLKEPTDTKYKGVRLELAVDKIVTCIAVGLPLLLISLAFAQEISVGTQISCFAPTNFSWRQAAYVDSYCWAAVQKSHLLDDENSRVPLWLHKFFPYILLLVAILMYIPSLFWRFTAAPHLFSDLAFIMGEFDRTYNRAIKLAAIDPQSSAGDLTETCFRYPIVEQYLKTKRHSKSLVMKYLFCRVLTLVILLLACLYLGYYINLASITDEFSCNIRTGILKNDSTIPNALQCKLVAVGVFQLLSYINLIIYILLAPVIVYATFAPLLQGPDFLKPYEMLPNSCVLDLGGRFYDDLSIYLLFLHENLSELKSYKCLKVLELLTERGGGVETFDMMGLLSTLGQVKTDAVDGKVQKGNGLAAKPDHDRNGTEMKDMSSPLLEGGQKEDGQCCDKVALRQRVS
ncbi:pannexin-1-like [Anguilla anguilla]|uniref:pannexin-1-like n=1 Tax=Anguilla anguilla TaxID=7936 RepID=UPI0015AE46FA|nr:pannexin-1-like [Anguilla anguilla]